MSNFIQKDKNYKISQFIQKILKTAEVIPSVSMTVVNETGVLYQDVFGYADLENKRLAELDSSYYIASCTKPFNALLCHILAEEGKINLYEPITNYKPFKNFKDNTIFQSVSIMDLLSHQSGLYNPYLSFRLAYTGEYSTQEIIRLIAEETQIKKEGKVFEYTDFGYYLLGFLLEAELGKSWKKLLEDKVFKPLKLQNTSGYRSEIPKNKLALPHSGAFKNQVKITPIIKSDQTMQASGGLFSTVEDASKLISFYLNEGKDIYPNYLVKDTYKNQVDASHELVRVFEGKGYASGWRLGYFNEEKVVYHFGNYTGYFSHISFIPEKKLGLVLFANSDFAMPVVNLITEYAYNLYFEKNDLAKQQEEELNNKIQINEALQKKRDLQLAFEKKLSTKAWRLSLPKEKYAGVFQNAKYGKIEILLKDEDLIFKAGNLKAKATPYAKEDKAWLSLIPSTLRQVSFELKNKEVIAFIHKKEKFERYQA